MENLYNLALTRITVQKLAQFVSFLSFFLPLYSYPEHLEAFEKKTNLLQYLAHPNISVSEKGREDK